jgi:hypothetical protein
MPLSLSLRTAEDWRSARTARRYMLQSVITPPAATAASNLFGIRKLAINPDVYISRIRVHYFNAAGSGAATIGWKRATTVAAGSLVTAADIVKNDTAAVNAATEMRAGAVTGTKANQYILTHPAETSVTAVTGGGIIDDWTARDLSERIRLTGDEGLILDWVTLGSTGTRIHMLFVWEEVA